MTTPAPYSPAPLPVPAQPTGVPLRPSPMDVGAVTSGAIAVYKARPLLFIGLALIPTVVTFVAVMAGFAALLPLAIAALDASQSESTITAIAMGTAAAIVGATFAWLVVQFKANGMMAVAAFDVIDGRLPTLASTTAQTRGLVRRVLPVAGAAALVTALAAAGLTYGFMGWFLRELAAISFPGSNDILAAVFLQFFGAFLGLGLVLGLVWLVVTFLSVRLLYFVPALALEKLDAVAALRRAWALTRGAFWRTLGYYVVAAVLVAIPSYAVSFISQFFAFPVSNTSSLPEAGALGIALAVLAGVLQLAVAVLVLPFQVLYHTLMYRDQVNRSTGNVVAPVRYGYARPGSAYPGVTPLPGGPVPPAPASQPWHQPNPAQQWPVPGQPWTPPLPAAAAPPAQPQPWTPPQPAWPASEVDDATRRRSDLVPPPASEQVPPPGDASERSPWQRPDSQPPQP